jgi:hypothetical protein
MHISFRKIAVIPSEAMYSTKAVTTSACSFWKYKAHLLIIENHITSPFQRSLSDFSNNFNEMCQLSGMVVLNDI